MFLHSWQWLGRITTRTKGVVNPFSGRFQVFVVSRWWFGGKGECGLFLLDILGLSQRNLIINSITWNENSRHHKPIIILAKVDGRQHEFRCTNSVNVSKKNSILFVEIKESHSLCNAPKFNLNDFYIIVLQSQQETLMTRL